MIQIDANAESYREVLTHHFGADNILQILLSLGVLSGQATFVNDSITFSPVANLGHGTVTVTVSFTPQTEAFTSLSKFLSDAISQESVLTTTLEGLKDLLEGYWTLMTLPERAECKRRFGEKLCGPYND